MYYFPEGSQNWVKIEDGQDASDLNWAENAQKGINYSDRFMENMW